MPINQSRLITQTNAAFLSLQALNRIRSYIASLQLDMQNGLTIAEAYTRLSTYIMDNEELFPPNPAFAPDLLHVIGTYNKIIHVVGEEIKHFNRNQQRNAMQANLQRLRRDRMNPDRQRRRSQPHTVFETSQLVQTTNQQPSFHSPVKEAPNIYSKEAIGDITEEEWKEMVAANTSFVKQSQPSIPPPLIKPNEPLSDDAPEDYDPNEPIMPPTGVNSL